MNMEQKKKKTNILPGILFQICLGMGIGLGALIHNIGVGLAIGAGFGGLFSLIAEFVIQKKKEDQ